jgi:glycogen debranching enzyme
MLPNRFPDEGQAPEYNTVDATLWYFEAIRAHYEATHDVALLRDLFPVLVDISDWHVRGTVILGSDKVSTLAELLPCSDWFEKLGGSQSVWKPLTSAGV